MYNYGLIGNCQMSALVNHNGSIDWMCLPRPDSPPLFGQLLDSQGGHFSITGIGSYTSRLNYIANTNVLVSVQTNSDGSSFKIIDFCPRFQQYGRMFRPISLFRIIEPINGSPTIRISCRPVNGWEREFIKPIRGNSHLRYEIKDDHLRVTTNMPLTYLYEETPFVLNEKIYFALTWNEGIEEDLGTVSERFLKETIRYWDTWVKHCSIPTLYQVETIRSALTLKLHCYEDTGAILAGLTTSLPEEIGNTRNWDYRFCWLRDAYFVLSAFQNLGHFEEMEGFIKFLLNIAEKHEHSKERLHPVYRLDQTLPIPEIVHPNWEGYQNSGPVRHNNQAAEHVQNDVYGEMVLALAPLFFDERFRHLRTKEHEQLLAHLAQLCIRNISKADAGLWEIRDGWQEHSFSNLMCWAGIDRVKKIQDLGYLKNVTQVSEAQSAAELAISRAVKESSLRNGPKDETLDASLLQIATLRFPDMSLSRGTIKKILSELEVAPGFLYRYLRNDDFGKPHSAFLICSFWLVQALAKIGEIDKAKEVMNHAMKASNSIGLFSEHFIPKEKRQLGNFPQAYSHVGQINAAFSISPPWGDII